MKGFAVGLCVIELYIPQSRSLKEKRQVLRSIKAKIKNGFNVVIAEVGAQNHWKSAVFGVVTLSNDKCQVNEVLDKVVGQIGRSPEVQVIHHTLEFF